MSTQKKEWWTPHGEKKAHLIPLPPDDDGTGPLMGPVKTVCGIGAFYEQLRHPLGYPKCDDCACSLEN